MTKLRIRRNPNWGRSALLGLKHGIYFAPTYLWNAIAWPVWSFITSTGLTVFMGLFFILMQITFVVAGLLGYLVVLDEDDK